MRSLSAKAALVLAMLAVPFVLAACGGGDGGSSSEDLNSADYDPADTTLKEAGFQVCGDANTQIPQNLGSGPGVQSSRAFFIAVDCNGKETSPNVAAVFQFDSLQAVEAGAKTIENALPNGSSSAYGPLVLVTTGPDHQENLAKIEQALQTTYPITTTTS